MRVRCVLFGMQMITLLKENRSLYSHTRRFVRILSLYVYFESQCEIVQPILCFTQRILCFIQVHVIASTIQQIERNEGILYLESMCTKLRVMKCP